MILGPHPSAAEEFCRDALASASKERDGPHLQGRWRMTAFGCMRIRPERMKEKPQFERPGVGCDPGNSLELVAPEKQKAINESLNKRRVRAEA